MSDMRVNNLNVDLIQDQAAISLVKQGALSSGKITHTIISINVPIGNPGDELESAIRRKAIDQARNALREAIEVLDAQAA